MARRWRSNSGSGSNGFCTRSESAPPACLEEQLVAKLQRIEALFSRSSTDGQRVAAERVRSRIKARLQTLAVDEPPVEFRFSLSDQ